MASPPKPWEKAGATPATSAVANPASSTSTTIPTTSSTAPAIPPLPASLTAAVNQNTAAYSRLGASPLGASPLGASPYGTYGGAYTSPYTSPYSRYGGYGGYGGGGMYGSYGGYGSMYNNMYGGMPGGMGGGVMQGVDPNNPESLTHRFNMSTQATFQMLEGIVGAFGNFAQMLESTYMTTHSSFFTMVAVAEQFGNLRDTLGSVLGIFTLMRWIRTLIAKLRGRPPPADATALTPAAFARFEGRQPLTLPDGTPGASPNPSRKPLFFFLLAAFGLPYVMSKVIRSLAANAEQQQQQQLVAQQHEQQQQLQLQTIDPSKLDFCRVLYDFTPPQPAIPDVHMDVRKGDLVAVLTRQDPMGNPSDWWRCRSRDGCMGYLPSSFLEVARKPARAQGQVMAIKAAAEYVNGTGSGESTRANTMTSLASGTSSADTAPLGVVVGTDTDAMKVGADKEGALGLGRVKVVSS